MGWFLAANNFYCRSRCCCFIRIRGNTVRTWKKCRAGRYVVFIWPFIFNFCTIFWYDFSLSDVTGSYAINKWFVEKSVPPCTEYKDNCSDINMKIERFLHFRPLAPYRYCLLYVHCSTRSVLVLFCSFFFLFLVVNKAEAAAERWRRDSRDAINVYTFLLSSHVRSMYTWR